MEMSDQNSRRFRTTKDSPIPKAADILACDLRQRILSGEWSPGEILPPERELVESSGLSRASVREALRILEVEALITTRAGRGGGSAVRHPSHEAIERSVRLFIRGHRSGLLALLEAREAIEPSVSRLAALNRTEADLAELDAIQQRLTDSLHDRATFLRANVDWHLAVAAASGNALLIGFMSAIAGEILAWTGDEALATDEIVRATIRSHAQITAAIRQRDAEAAGRRMFRHIASYSDVARSTPAQRAAQGV